MNDDAGESEIEAPDIVHWSPRHGATIGGPRHGSALPLTAIGAIAAAGAALGFVAVGAAAIGALAIGRLRVGEADVKTLRIGRLEVGDLVILRRDGEES